jgi:amino acid adenylation domain-containing protein
LKISYDKRRFDDVAIKQMLGNLKTLLEGMAENIDRPLSALPILSESERDRLLKEWNDTHVHYPNKEKCVHHLFEDQVELTPDAVALVFEDRQLTYRQLNGRANQVAHYLRKLGVGPETRVGIYMERSLEMMVGMLGILKAGGAYVPLDPEYPDDRVAYMMEDTRVPVVLTQRHLEDRLPANQSKVLCLDSAWDIIAKEKAEGLMSGVRPENVAYVIYTSGSTGKPKGVMNEHRGIVNRLIWMQDEYRLTDVDRILQKTPFSFDVSVWEFFWGLLFGARLVMAQPGGHRDSAYLVDTILREGITTLHFVPSMLQAFLEDERVEKCRGLKRVMCSGEALPYALQRKFFNKLGTVELHNLYGPTEAAVDVTYWRCQQDSDLPVVPIGRPVANTQMYILNKWMRPMPIGVPGELHIGGVQVARGYLNRPELTAEKFVPDPFSSQTGARLYKTGDLCRYLPDGSIEYLGRIDNQVKIHGFRIELGEIETLLEQQPVVGQAVVMAREDVPGDKQLVAYIVPDGVQSVSVSALRKGLKEKLPEYMVPNAFVMIEKFPLSPNGKIDRRSLPSPAGLRPELESAFVPPRTEIERTITAIWQGVLQLEKIGVNDNFFDLGGHSLRMAQVHSRLREKLQRDLSMLEMFKYPTITSLAHYLSQGEGEQRSLNKNDDRAEKLKEGKNRLKQRFRQREQAAQSERSIQDE